MSFTVVDVIFVVLSIFTVLSALFLIFVRDLFRAAIAFIGALLSLAGLFILLNAEFIGAVQILVNIGAVAILLIVTIMLIRDLAHGSSAARLSLSILGFGVAALTFATIALGIISTDWVTLLVNNPNAESVILGSSNDVGVLNDTVAITGKLLLRDFVLVFEILGVIIAAAVIGSIAILRGAINDDDLQEPEQITQ